MIPQRIKLKGFLCYKDEQEVTFDESSLWMLAGLNGSGKSSIFDAVTYALFGYHRGGNHNAQELINKDCDRLLVEFEFTLDGKPYLAKRTLQLDARGSPRSTFQISQRGDSGGNGKSWRAIEGTDKKAGFDEWIRNNIGLDYKTFTSSILLLQGHAEKLLEASARDRFEVLAGIVDLDKYEQLHKRADDQRRNAERDVDRLTAQLATLPEVTAQSLNEAEQRIAVTEAARQQAETEVERLLQLQLRAQQWGELQEHLDRTRQRWQQAQQLLADAPRIEQAARRLEELRDVLPPLQTVVEQRSELHKSTARTADLLKQQEKVEALLADRVRASEQLERQRINLEARAAVDEQKQREVGARLRQTTGILEKLKEYERQAAEHARLQEELGRLPADPAIDQRAARDLCDRLTVAAQAALQLGQFQRWRDALRQARAREQQAAVVRNEIQERDKQLAERLERFRPEVEEAGRAARLAAEEATRTRTLMEQAQGDLEEITQLQGAKRCRHCGQPLTEGHLHEEQLRRTGEAAQAEDAWRQAVDRHQTALKFESEQRQQLAELEKQLATAREEYRAHDQQGKQAHEESQRCGRECAQVHAELVEPFRTRVSAAPPADWLDTSFPTPDELSELRQEAAGLSAARQRLQEVDVLVQRWHALQAQEKLVAQNLAHLRSSLPADPPSVRQEHVRLEAEEKALDSGLEALRNEIAGTQKQLDQLGKEREQLQRQLANIRGDVNTEEARRQHCQQSLNRALNELPSAWRAPAESAGSKELFLWHNERDELEREGAGKRGLELAQARASAEAVKQDLEARERQQEEFPPEARQAPAQVALQLAEARKNRQQRDGEYNQACQQKSQLERDQQQRQQLQHDLLEAEKNWAQLRKLAELLGRNRLQLHLVRQAERQVKDHANAVLDRLSGGQLSLRLSSEAGGEGASLKALELEAFNRVTGEQPIGVAFLSGSQKFRVAVSLALGIGQYASRQHRPIESVIIDEGFGCLDREGRQAMIQELQNLRGQLRCILLVSHQEEFADAFADGYRFELQDGATKVSRFQR